MKSYSVRNIIAISIVTVLGILTLLYVAGHISYSPGFLKSRVEKILNAIADEPVTLSRVSIVPWKKVTLHNLHLEVEKGDTLYDITADELQIQYPFWKVFNSRGKLKSLIKEKKGRRFFQAVLSDYTVYGLSKKIMADFSLRVLKKKWGTDTLLHAGNCSIALTNKSARHFFAEGEMTAAWIQWGSGYTLEKVRSEIEMTEEMIIIKNGKAGFCQGLIDFNLITALFAPILHTADIQGRKIQLGEVYAASGITPGTLSGEADFSCHFDSSRFTADSLEGRGRFSLTRVKAINTPLQRDLFLIVALSELKALEFDNLQSSFVLSKGKIFTDSISGKGGEITLQGNGWLTFRGQLNQNITLTFSEKYSRNLEPLVRESLLPRSDGSRYFTCRMSGSFTRPKIHYDNRVIKRAAKNAIKSLKKEFKKFFK